MVVLVTKKEKKYLPTDRVHKHRLRIFPRFQKFLAQLLKKYKNFVLKVQLQEGYLDVRNDRISPGEQLRTLSLDDLVALFVVRARYDKR